jgi:hypothetical protein
MAQSFPNISALNNFINTKIIPNGIKSITGQDENDVQIALSNFIVSYGINTTSADVSSASGIILLTKPVTLFTGSLPTSIQWPDNVQNQYYIVNTFGVPIPLSAGFSYLDEALVERTNIPALSAVQIMKAENGSWIKVNTATAGAIEIPNQAGDDAVEVSGTLGRIISINVSPDSGNTFEIRDNGAYAAGGGGGGNVNQEDF